MAGKMTKKCQEFLKLDKEYEAEIQLGFTSTTGDPEGEITKKSDKKPGIGEIQEVLKKFTGEIEQTPPRYSAIKIKGRRAYKLAREGQDFEMPRRKVTIYNVELIEYKYPVLKIRAEVSSGTYIRSLAEDIGEELKTGAYCVKLRRTKIGGYDVKEAENLDELRFL